MATLVVMPAVDAVSFLAALTTAMRTSISAIMIMIIMMMTIPNTTLSEYDSIHHACTVRDAPGQWSAGATGTARLSAPSSR